MATSVSVSGVDIACCDFTRNFITHHSVIVSEWKHHRGSDLTGERISVFGMNKVNETPAMPHIFRKTQNCCDRSCCLHYHSIVQADSCAKSTYWKKGIMINYNSISGLQNFLYGHELISRKIQFF